MFHVRGSSDMNAKAMQVCALVNYLIRSVSRCGLRLFL